MNQNILLHPHDHKKIKDWQLILNFIESNLKDKKIDSVLELGGGLGNIAYCFALKNASAIVEDINDDYLQQAKNRHPKINILNHDINTPLPFSENSFDLVTCTGTLHYGYIQDVHKILAEMARVSRRYLLIDFLSRYAPYRFLEKIYNPHYAPLTYSRKEVFNLLKNCQLKSMALTGSKTFPPLNGWLPFTGKTVYCLCERF